MLPIFRFVALVVVFCFSTPSAWALVGYDVADVREGAPATNYRVTIYVANADASMTGNDVDCGGSSCHKTFAVAPATTPRFYSHVHLSSTAFALPSPLATSIDDTGNQRSATAANVNAYWDWYYPGYTRQGSPDLTFNCWRYSMMHAPCLQQGCWIQDPSYIYSDEYDSVASLNATGKHVVRMTIGGQDSHVLNIVSVAQDGEGGDYYVTSTIEKNRGSAVYSKSYLASAHKSFSNLYRAR